MGNFFPQNNNRYTYTTLHNACIMQSINFCSFFTEKLSQLSSVSILTTCSQLYWLYMTEPRRNKNVHETCFSVFCLKFRCICVLYVLGVLLEIIIISLFNATKSNIQLMHTNELFFASNEILKILLSLGNICNKHST